MMKEKTVMVKYTTELANGKVPILLEDGRHIYLHEAAEKLTRYENALTRITQDCTARKSVMIARNALTGKGHD